MNPQLEQHILDSCSESRVEDDEFQKNNMLPGRIGTKQEENNYVTRSNIVCKTTPTVPRHLTFIIGIFVGYCGSSVSRLTTFLQTIFSIRIEDDEVVSTTKCLSLLLFVSTLIFIQNWRWPTGKNTLENSSCESMKTSYNNIQTLDAQIHECRVEMSETLASVGAPPMTTIQVTETGIDLNNNPVKNTPDVSKVLKLVENFGHAHVHLLRCFDRSINIIRICTSLQLGLDTSSKFVERLELTMLGRDQRRIMKEQQSDRKPMALTVQNTRVLLWKMMLRQWTLLESIFCHLDVPNDECYNLPTPEQPHVITVSCLKAFRQDLADILTLVLSNLTTRSVLRIQEKSSLQISDVLIQGLRAAGEDTKYVTRTFFIDDSSSDGKDDDDKRNPSSHIFERYIFQMCQQLDAAYVALWASENDGRVLDDKKESISHNSVCFDSHDENCLQEWFVRIKTLLATTVATHDEMIEHYEISKAGHHTNNDMSIEIDTPHSNDGDGVVYGSNNESEGARKQSFSSTETPTDNVIKTRTAVFAGNGTLHLRPLKCDSESKKISSRQNTRNYKNMFNELENRLSILELAEEVEVTRPSITGGVVEESIGRNEEIIDSNGHSEENANGITGQPTGRPPASNIFLGASGNLLLELKASLNPANVDSYDVGDSDVSLETGNS